MNEKWSSKILQSAKIQKTKYQQFIFLQLSKPMQKSHKSPLSIQIDAISKYLEGVKKQDIFDFSQRIYPVQSSQQPYMCLYLAIKKQAFYAKSKGLNLGEFAHELISKAYLAGELIGNRFMTLIKEEPQFLVRFDPNAVVSTSNLKMIQQQEEKKEAPVQQQSSMQSLGVNNQIEGSFESKFPLKSRPSPIMQRLTPVSSPLRSCDFMFDSPIIKPKSPQMTAKDPALTYKIGGPRPTESESSKNNSNSNEQNNKPNVWMQVMKEIRQEDQKKEQEKREKQNEKYEKYEKEKPKSALEQKIDSISQKNKNAMERLLSNYGDPLSSARPVTMSPSKPIFSTTTTTTQFKPFSNFPPPPKPPTLFPPPSTTKSASLPNRHTDTSSLHNLSNRRQCLCETSCDNIVLSEDSFYCQHCENIYHTRCMRKQTDSRNCVICHLRLMMPNRLVMEEVFVGLLKKNKKRHEIGFQLSEQMFHFLRSKKDFSHKLMLRCFRLKPQTQNQNLFPDSCTITINGKQLKEFKPLHKQSSLKYRRDQPLAILKHYTPGENKIIVNQFHNTNGLDRIQPEDHLVGLYVVEEQGLNATVQRIIREDVTSLKESKELLSKAFNMSDRGNKSEEEVSEEEAITCEVIKIPLTCALTTEKLNYAARGVFCKHFQCFDLKNYIMMTSSSSNPRWVCPICKASCYEFQIDCILTQILNQYTGCDKVDVLVLYKDGMYEVIDRDEDAIDSKGNKLKNPEPKDIKDLKIIDKFKREREKEAEKEYLEQQEAEQKKKKKVVELPPEDQIVCLLSDDD